LIDGGSARTFGADGRTLRGRHMALLGHGAFVAWHGIAEGREADYDRWHSHEHMLERVGIPGFLRGRRYVATGSGPRYFILYETADIGVLTAPAYLERLNNPTAWTRKVMPAIRGMVRTLCRVGASVGRGVGHALLTTRLSPQPGQERALADRLRIELERWAGSPGLVGAHLLQADAAASQTPTRERQLRAQPDAVADWVLLAEGYDTAAVRALRGGGLSPGALEALGASPGAVGDLYRLVHLVTRDDLPDPSAAGPDRG
jgi:hypothetical protein